MPAASPMVTATIGIVSGIRGRSAPSSSIRNARPLPFAVVGLIHVFYTMLRQKDIWLVFSVYLKRVEVVPLDRPSNFFTILKDHHHFRSRIDLFAVIVNL